MQVTINQLIKSIYKTVITLLIHCLLPRDGGINLIYHKSQKMAYTGMYIACSLEEPEIVRNHSHLIFKIILQHQVNMCM